MSSHSPKAMLDAAWYRKPLDFEDFVAGGSLLVMGILSISLNILVARIMRKHDKEVVGYRFLISAAIADILLLFNYGIWPGLTILFKSEIISVKMRSWVQLYLDWAWFSMVWHFTMVGWSRWLAIRKPVTFKNQRKRTSYALCVLCYIVAFVQVMCTHFQPWYVTFYYEPSSYGMLAEDFERYMSSGQSTMFLSFHAAAIIPAIVFYAWSVMCLIYRRRSSILATSQASHLSNIESRLLLPCVINLAFFVVGQVVITYGTGEGKWAGYTVMVLFAANSAVNSILLAICSQSIRKQLLVLLGMRPASYADKVQDTTIYQNKLAIQVEQIRLSTNHDVDGSHESVVYV